MERQLTADLQDKQEELDRLKSMLADKKLEVESKGHALVYQHDDGMGGEAYAKINKEVDQVKLMLLDLRA
jgi:hypothetical protein